MENIIYCQIKQVKFIKRNKKNRTLKEAKEITDVVLDHFNINAKEKYNDYVDYIKARLLNECGEFAFIDDVVQFKGKGMGFSRNLFKDVVFV